MPAPAHTGPDGAGRVVTTAPADLAHVDTRLDAEAHDLLRDVAGFAPDAIAATFRAWHAARPELGPPASGAVGALPAPPAPASAAGLPGPAPTELHPEDAARFAVQVEQALYASKVMARAALLDRLAEGDHVRVWADAQAAWRTVVATAARAGVPTPGFAAALGSYDALRTGRTPYFGAHVYGSIDGPLTITNTNTNTNTKNMKRKKR
ncbi:hypothetical protein [Streptomyces sp. RerS4]|uniref:hypothetical protein n=1 Tax=Streptomyces sp. RerS4 TaxID=2942449 RepID=UPI00201BB617|nr:hypothetical protein [Streptomyces sp. RerS4]UQX05343.1 hypothetical protein M4D82_33205 [Streptomyces sp. RerS4]